MSCIIKKNGKIEVKAPNGAASLLFEKAKFFVENNPKLKLKGKTTEEKALDLYSKAITIDTKLDVNGEPDLSLSVIDKSLSNKVRDNLMMLLKSKGVNIVGMQDYFKNYELQKGFKMDARGVADTLNNVIASDDPKTLTEEAVHMMSAAFREDPTFERLLRLVDTTPEFSEYDQYLKIYGDDKLARKEILDKIITKHINGEVYSNRIVRGIKTLLNKMFGLFKTHEIDMFARDIVKQLEGNNLDLGEFTIDQVQYNLDENLDVEFNLESEINDLQLELYDLASLLGEKNDANKNRFLKKIKDTEALLETKSFRLASIRVINDIQDSITEGLEFIKEIENGSITNAARTLSKIDENIRVYDKFISVLTRNLDDEQLPQEVESEINKLIRRYTRYKNDFKEAQLSVAESISSPFTKMNKYLKEGEYRKFLQEVKDISFISEWTQALGNINDDVLKVVDQMFKRGHEKTRIKTKDESEELLLLRSKITDYDDLRFIQKRREGGLTRYLVNKEGIDFGMYYESQNNFFDNQLYPDFNLSLDPEKRKEQFAEMDASQKEAFNKAKNKWIRDNSEVIPNLDSYLASKIKKIARDVFVSADPKLINEVIKRLKANRYINDQRMVEDILVDYGEINDRDRESLQVLLFSINQYMDQNRTVYKGKITYKRELVVPNDNYRNDQWDQLSKAEQDYAEALFERKKKLYELPVSLNELYKIPQARKSTAERFQGLDYKGLMRGVKESFTVTEDEIDYGDETTEVKVIPVFFIREVPLDDMSTDMNFIFNSFSYMANHYIETNKIKEELLLMQDLVVDRNILNKKGKLTGTKGGNAADALASYIDMNMYGRSKEQEGTKGRVLDVLNKWTSFLGMGYNFIAPAANLLQTASVIAQERYTGVYDKEAFKLADKYYAKLLPDSVLAYDNPEHPSKLLALSRMFNIKDNPKQDLIYQDLAVNKTLRRVMASPYTLNNLGEHYGNHKVAFAILADTKVLVNGKESTLLESIDYKDFSAFVPKTVTNLDGSKITQDQLSNISLKINDANQRLFGIYNNIDKAKMQRYAMGRSLLVFRKFIVDPFNRRFNAEQFNYQQNETQEGMYRSFYSLVGNIKNSAAELGFSLHLVKNQWNELTDLQKRNIHKSALEMGVALGALGLFYVLSNAMGDDEEDYPLTSYMALQLNRHFSEMSFFWNPTQVLEILKSPAVTINLINTIIALPFVALNSPFNWDESILRRYKDGTDDSYVYRYATKLTPIYSNVNNLWNFNKTYEQYTK